MTESLLTHFGFEERYRRLKKHVYGSRSVPTTEAYLLLAIAALETGHAEELEFALTRAAQRGADTSLLER